MTIQDKVTKLKLAGITPAIISTLDSEIIRLEGTMEKAGILTQDDHLDMLIKFVEILEMKIDGIYNNGIDKILPNK